MFQGSIVALVTPFNEQDEIDFPALEGLVEFHLEQGSDGLVVAGTTGESVALDQSEFCAILEQVVTQVSGRIPVLAGTGSASLRRTLDQTQMAAAHGADAALVVTPYYVRPPQRGLEAHFRAVAEASDIPIVLYNVPSRTSVDILPATVEKLALHDNIIGIKEALGERGRIEELRARCGQSFTLLSGDDYTCLQAMKSGADGVISVAANVVPSAMVEMCTAARQRDWAAASSVERSLKELFDRLMIETNPIPVKWSLFEMNLIGPHVRLPLTELGDEFREPVSLCLQALKLIPA